ncbi:hypothetical protein niasHT_036371 [Heterodera trifolii]|uniref:Uncharacterized protein n=1 Tax=Heterodera trifolii TaxID=157864 RepID=A0ABD2IUE9_9BILA
MAPPPTQAFPDQFVDQEASLKWNKCDRTASSPSQKGRSVDKSPPESAPVQISSSKPSRSILIRLNAAAADLNSSLLSLCVSGGVWRSVDRCAAIQTDRAGEGGGRRGDIPRGDEGWTDGGISFIHSFELRSII